jgi:hypothetical protein
VIVTIKRLITWWHIPGTTRLEWEAAANGLLSDHLRLHKQGRQTRRARGTILPVRLAGLADRLESRFPDRWQGTTGDAVSAEFRGRGVPSAVVKMSGVAARGCRAADVEKAREA